MSSLVIVAIANCCEPFWTELALVRFFPCVNPNVHLEITTFIKLFVANHFLTSFGVSPNYLSADKVLILFLLSWHLTEILHHRHGHWVLPFLIIMTAELSETKVRKIVIQLVEDEVPIDVRVMVLLMVEARTWLNQVFL
jgi:hypothetical protein